MFSSQGRNAGSKAWKRLICLHECFLHNILGLLNVASNHIGYAERHVLVITQKRAIGLGITLSCPFNQRWLVQNRSSHSCHYSSYEAEA
jgi:hypothetical protein